MKDTRGQEESRGRRQRRRGRKQEIDGVAANMRGVYFYGWPKYHYHHTSARNTNSRVALVAGGLLGGHYSVGPPLYIASSLNGFHSGISTYKGP